MIFLIVPFFTEPTQLLALIDTVPIIDTFCDFCQIRKNTAKNTTKSVNSS